LQILERKKVVVMRRGMQGFWALVLASSLGTMPEVRAREAPRRTRLEIDGYIPFALAWDRFGYFLVEDFFADPKSGAPARLVQVRLSNMTVVRSLSLEAGETSFRCGIAVGEDAYLGGGGSPGRVVHVDLRTLRRVGAVDLEPGEDDLSSVLVDDRNVYFGTDTRPGRVVKLARSPLQRVGSVVMSSGESYLRTATRFDGYGYFSGNYPSQLVKVDLERLEPMGTMPIEDHLEQTVAFGGVAYLAGGEEGSADFLAHLVKVDLSGFVRQAGRQLVDLAPISFSTSILVGDTAYFGTLDSIAMGLGEPGSILKLDRGGLTFESVVSFERGFPTATVAFGDSLYVAVGDFYSSRLVRVPLGMRVPTPTPTSTPRPVATVGTGPAASRVLCLAIGLLAGVVRVQSWSRRGTLSTSSRTVQERRPVPPET
jgi:hypothetical protein